MNLKVCLTQSSWLGKGERGYESGRVSSPAFVLRGAR